MDTNPAPSHSTCDRRCDEHGCDQTETCMTPRERVQVSRIRSVGNRIIQEPEVTGPITN